VFGVVCGSFYRRCGWWREVEVTLSEENCANFNGEDKGMTAPYSPRKWFIAPTTTPALGKAWQKGTKKIYDRAGPYGPGRRDKKKGKRIKRDFSLNGGRGEEEEWNKTLSRGFSFEGGGGGGPEGLSAGLYPERREGGAGKRGRGKSGACSTLPLSAEGKKKMDVSMPTSL